LFFWEAMIEDRLDQPQNFAGLLVGEPVEALEIGLRDQGKTGFPQISDPDQGEFPKQSPGRTPVIGSHNHQVMEWKVLFQAD
jgi:hypothetical protein